MHGQHRRRDVAEAGDGRRGVPVVQVQEVRSQHSRERRDGHREAEEAGVVVGPSLAVLVQVRMGPPHARHVDQGERPDGVVTATASDGRACPRGHVQLEALLAGQLDAAVVGEHRFHLHSLRRELADEPRGRVREATDGDERGELGGGEDPHAYTARRRTSERASTSTGPRAGNDVGDAPGSAVRSASSHVDANRRGGGAKGTGSGAAFRSRTNESSTTGSPSGVLDPSSLPFRNNPTTLAPGLSQSRRVIFRPSERNHHASEAASPPGARSGTGCGGRPGAAAGAPRAAA